MAQFWALDQTRRNMNAIQLSDQFLKSLDEITGSGDRKWAYTEFRTGHGIKQRNGFLDACSELFVLFEGKPKPVIYEAVRETMRRRGGDHVVQRYLGMVLLNLVPDAYGQIDELIDIIAPLFDLNNREIPAFLVEQVGTEALLKKIEVRRQAAMNSDLANRLNGIACQVRGYQSARGSIGVWSVKHPSR